VNPHHLPQIATIFEEVGTLKEDGSYLIAAMLLNNLDANLRKLPPTSATSTRRSKGTSASS